MGKGREGEGRGGEGSGGMVRIHEQDMRDVLTHIQYVQEAMRKIQHTLEF